MKKFSFPGAVVAGWSGQKMALAQLTVSRIVKEMMDLDEQIEALAQQAQDARVKLQQQSAITGHELGALGHYVRKLGEQRNQLQRMRSDVVRRLADQRQVLLAEHRRVKLLENLHDVRKQEWLQELTKEEESLASDLFLAKRGRTQQMDQGI